MSKSLEDSFNDCFERLLSGESLESCLKRYPEHAHELETMLRTAFDVKRRAFPIQPRPEFKYWARVRLRGAQDYVSNQPSKSKPGIFHWQRSWAFVVTAILILVIATGGTAAASSEALPDEPLYEVKLAIEQAQIAITFSETDKIELHARLIERRAQEIAAMASQGKTDKVTAVSTQMTRQLNQMETILKKIETASPASTSEPPTAALPMPSTLQAPSSKSFSENLSNWGVGPSKSQVTALDTNARQDTASIDKAKSAVNQSTLKSLTILQNALDKAPDSVKPNLNQVIERTKKVNEQIQLPIQNPSHDVHPKQNKEGTKPPHETTKPSSVKPSPDLPADKPKPLPGSSNINPVPGRGYNPINNSDNHIK